MDISWKKVKLSYVLSERGYIRGPFGSALRRDELLSSGIPVYEQQHAIYGSRIFRFFINESKHKSLYRFTVQPQDIIISCSGTIGRISVIRDSDPIGIISQALLLLRPNADIIDPWYLFYFLSSPVGFHSLVSVSTGSVQVNIAKRSVIENIEIPLPPLPIQQRIADILGALDDKIELNQRMNATLEAIARALFKAWFVDFEPVRAKLDGRWQRGQSLPGLPAHLYDLFPDQLVDSELGEIPQGWGVGRLDDVLILQRGFDLPTPDRIHGKYPVIAASGPNGFHDKFMVSGPGVATGRSGVLGRVFFIHDDFWPLNTSLWVKEFKRVSPIYAFHLLQDLNLGVFNAGSAVPTLNRNHVHNLQVVIPPKHVVEIFDVQAMSLMQRQKSNETQSRTLTTIRDTLLPKLLSGEVAV